MTSLTEIIEALTKRNGGVQAAALFDADGLSVASSLNSSVDPDIVAAIASTLLSNGEKLLKELDQGELSTAMFQGNSGFTLLTRCSDDLVFAVLATPKSRLGLLLVDIRRTAKALSEALG